MLTERVPAANRVEVDTPSIALAVVAVIGEHDLAQSGMLIEALATAAARRRDVLVDLSRCDFFDSTVISVLLDAQDEVTSDGGRFALVIPADAPHATRVVEVMQLTDILPIHASSDEALHAFEHVTQVRDVREASRGADLYRAECSCGWLGDREAGMLALRHAAAGAAGHLETRTAVLPPPSRVV
jgi:anti-sigma B factor antagonist